MKITNSNIKISIIVPHKNSFNLLLRLLKSIPDDNMFQVIVVDDNSDEPVICDLRNYDFKKNISIIYNSSSGFAGKARNIGMEHAEGEWILFADADDYFSINMSESINRYKDSTSDIVYFDTYSIYNDSKAEAYRHLRYSNLVHNYLDGGEEDALRYYFTPPWSKMIRRSLITDNNLKFDEVIASNDIYFSISVANLATKISATKDLLYIISVTSGSLTNSFSKQHFDSKFEVALKANDFLREIGKKKYQQSILYFLLKSYKFGFSYMISVIYRLLQHRSNIFIGFSKIFTYRSVLKERENPKYLKKHK